jgi:hypothetical protein
MSLLLSCEKKKEVICTETCCDPYATRYKYVTEIRDAEADYANGGFWLKNPINGVNGIGVCNLTLDKVAGLKNTFDPTNRPNLPFVYRVWGTVYHDIDGVSVGGNAPIHFLRLDKVQTNQ